jgi:hypothetical protein
MVMLTSTNKVDYHSTVLYVYHLYSTVQESAPDLQYATPFLKVDNDGDSDKR